MTEREYQIIEPLLVDAKRAVLILGVVLIAVLMAMVIDLVAGIRKAKKAGVARTSYGYRRTINKFCRYYTALLLSSLVDAVLIVGDIFDSPYIACLVGVGLCFIEFKSWFEKLEDKEQSRLLEAGRVLADIAGKRVGIDATQVVDMLDDNKDKEVSNE